MDKVCFKGFIVATICILFTLAGCESTPKEVAVSEPVDATAPPPPPPPPASPSEPAPFYTAKFDTSADGWTLTPWKAGNYETGLAMASTVAGHPAGSIEASGNGQSNNKDACTREGGEIGKNISTAEYKSISIDYDLFFDTNKTGADCVGSLRTCPVLEGDCADKLAVYYSSTGSDGPWTLLEQIAAENAPHAEWQHRTIDLSTISTVDNNANFSLKFKFQFNNTTDIGRLDNIQLTGVQ